MNVFWFFPTGGDGRYLATSKGARAVDFDYLRQIARAAETLGYDGCLFPTGRSYEDTWVTAASLIGETRKLKMLVALRPGLMSPTLAARMAATLDRLSGGRLLINIVSSGDPHENRGDGLFLDHDERYVLTDEFLDIWRKLCAGDEVNFTGKHLTVERGQLLLTPEQAPHPPLYLGGSSPAAMEVAAKHIDVYLTWGEPLAQVAEKIAAMRALAAKHGRSIRFGIRLHVIVRETEAEAWAAADDLIRYVDDAAIESAKKVWARLDSVGQRRMESLHNSRRDSLIVGPNLWAGIGLVRGGAGTALVGNPDQVADRMREYAALGIDTFIFSGYPHLEEAYRLAELVFPLMKSQREQSAEVSIERPALRAVRATGEAIATNHHPALAGAAQR